MDGLLKRYGFGLSSNQLEKLALFQELLLEQNKVVNLTAVTDPAEIAVKHFLDSMTGAKYLEGKNLIADIGCGAGFPSVPLSILLPEARFVMLDAVGKKIVFLKTVIANLALNAEAKHARIEDEAKLRRDSFDAAVARAVSSLPTLLEYALPILKVGGLFVAYKGEKGKEELALSERALSELGGKTVAVDTFSLEGNTRTLIAVEKIKATPPKYPRGANKPRLAPL